MDRRLDHREREALDNHITGHYGEDQFRGGPPRKEDLDEDDLLDDDLDELDFDEEYGDEEDDDLEGLDPENESEELE